jgi:hypothetical protein
LGFAGVVDWVGGVIVEEVALAVVVETFAIPRK